MVPLKKVKKDVLGCADRVSGGRVKRKAAI